MRKIAFLAAAAVLLVAAAPAEAAWKHYGCSDDSVAAAFPGKPSAAVKGEFKLDIVVTAPSRTYSLTQDGVVYKIEVVDYQKYSDLGASILIDVLNMHERDGKVIDDGIARLEPISRGATYGRVITMDLKGGGRQQMAIFFRKGKLYRMSATITPDGDQGSPDVTRFIQSLMFDINDLIGRVPGYDTMPGCKQLPPAKELE